MDKTSQRKQIKEIKTHFSAEELKSFSFPVLSHLEKDIRFILSKTVLLYHSLPDEVNTHDFIEKWYPSKNIILPKIKGRDLTLHLYTGTSCLHSGTFNILEPDTPEYTEYKKIDLAIIPGVAFDKEGNRLGRGRGYYDKLFEKLDKNNIYKIGLAFPFQILEKITTEKFDIKMDTVIF